MAKRQDHIRLGAFLSGAGSHLAGWRHPDAQLDAAFDIQHYVRYAQLLEQAGFDALFMNDNFELGSLQPELLSRNTHTSRWDPLTVLPALAMVTSRIGLIGTVNTSYNEPFNVARRFASLDVLSKGRAGWNVVTALGGGENFNREDHLAHAVRYARAEEFVDVVTGLWDSWGEDAFIRDKSSGQWVDASKLKLLNHRGTHFSVRGPLNTPRSDQGRPVIAQAGSSGEGMALAARTAELVFTAQQELADSQQFYQALKQQAAAYGRSANDVLVLPGISTVVGRSRQEAQEKYEQLQQNLDPVVIFNSILSYIDIRLDISNLQGDHLQLDQPVQLAADIATTQSHQSRQKLVLDWIRKHNPTYRELLYHMGAGGHRTLVGTPEDIADDLEQWFEAHAADGFMLMFSHLPTALEDFTSLVVPELVHRGLFRKEYTGQTLREHLGVCNTKFQT
jgi:FMN-dependent oxidoreductase (nitrilotriacetate monooxygenase family)